MTSTTLSAGLQSFSGNIASDNMTQFTDNGRSDKSIAKCYYISNRLNVSLTGSEFYRISAVTEKALVPTFVLTVGTISRLELDDQSCM